MRIVTIGTAVAVVLGLAAAPAAAGQRARRAPEPPPAAAGPADEEAAEAPGDEPEAEAEEAAAPAEDGTAAAETGAPQDAILFHWPVSEARPDRRGLAISARWQGTFHGRALRLRWRHGDDGPWNTEPFAERRGVLEARIPAGQVRAPGLSYYIESVEADGTTRARFGSEADPQVIRVPEDTAQQARRDRLAGHDGHRNRFEATFRHVDFGRRLRSDPHSVDAFNELDLAYTFRPLLAGLYQATMGFLLVGDKMGVTTPDAPASGRPGAYLAFVKLYWEFADVFGLEPMLIFGASRAGLEPGGGMTFRFGTIRGTHFDIGIKGVRSLGWSFVTELDLKAAKFLRIRARNELTNWPTDPAPDSQEEFGIAPYGILPSLGLAFLLPHGFEINGSIGYGIRKGYDRGWIHGTAGVAVEF